MDSTAGSDRAASMMPTWHIFMLIACIWLAVSAYANERVLAPEVMAGVVGRATGVEMSGAQLDQLGRQGRWAYPLLPALLAIRIAVVALVLQLFSMLMAHPLPYREAFRAGLCGFGAVIYGTFIRMLRLDLLPAGALTRAELAVVPDSLAVFILAEGGPVLSAALSLLSLHDAFWIGIVAAYLHALASLGRGMALAVALGAWLTTALVRLGAQVFMIGMLG